MGIPDHRSSPVDERTIRQIGGGTPQKARQHVHVSALNSVNEPSPYFIRMKEYKLAITSNYSIDFVFGNFNLRINKRISVNTIIKLLLNYY